VAAVRAENVAAVGGRNATNIVGRQGRRPLQTGRRTGGYVSRAGKMPAVR